jgi:hypothetical protein
MSETEPPTAPVPPKRGGLHPKFGRFIGGAKLNDLYETIGRGGASLYRFATQRRHAKTVASIEKTLRETRNATNGNKFNGTLEPGKDNSSEIGKERFVALLKKRVTEHGQQTFYYIKDTDGKVVDLFEHAHRFKLVFVIAEHEQRMEENDLHESYDRIKRDDCELSRGVV